MESEAKVSELIKVESDRLSKQIVGAAIEVHRWLGPGLLESAYEDRLCRELTIRGVPFVRQASLPVHHKGLELECVYRLDLIVGGLVIVELKSVEQIESTHKAQLMTYLRLKKLWLGLLINFNVPVLKDGIKRIGYG